jgi:arsenate reductase (thioredoxin)
MRIFLFACIHNAGRSQMAAAFFNRFVDPAKARALSAGTDPGPHVHPEVVAVMREIGIDLSRVTPQKLTDDLVSQADMLITMGCEERCPYISGLQRVDWPLPDPKGKDIESVRAIRDEIRERVYELLIGQMLFASASE